MSQHCPLSPSNCLSPQSIAYVTAQLWNKHKTTSGKLRGSILTEVPVIRSEIYRVCWLTSVSHASQPASGSERPLWHLSFESRLSFRSVPHLLILLIFMCADIYVCLFGYCCPPSPPEMRGGWRKEGRRHDLVVVRLHPTTLQHLRVWISSRTSVCWWDPGI